MKYSHPVRRGTRKTQGFGEKPGGFNPGGGHTGNDWALNYGDPIYACGDGIVEHAGPGSGSYLNDPYWVIPDFAGNWITINHGRGEPASIYGHLATWDVRVGQTVRRGQRLGGAGRTGAASGVHVHHEMLPDKFVMGGDPTYGRRDPAIWCGDSYALEDTITITAQGGVTVPTVALAPAERLVDPGYTIKGRTEANASAPIVRTIDGPAREILDGWINGEVIGGNGIWFHDTTPAWYWSGNFADHTTTGLPDLNPKPVLTADPKQRETGDGGAQRRSAPDKNAAPVGDRFAPELLLDFRGHVTAKESPYGDGNKTWFVGAYGTPTYFWSGSFKDTGTHDLPDLTADLFPTAQQPAVPPPVITAPYNFDLDFLTINGITVEKFPAYLGNVDVGNFPATPGMEVCHWWNSLANRPDFMSVVREFQKEGTYKSSHWVVTDDRIGQMASLKDRTYHAGAGGNGWVGTEVDPRAIEKNPDGTYTARALRIQANVRALTVLLREKYGAPIGLILHKNVPGNATACSDLDLATFEPPAPPVPVPAPPTAVRVPPTKDQPITALIEYYK